MIHNSTQVIQQFKRRWEGSRFVRQRHNSNTATTVSVKSLYRINIVIFSTETQKFFRHSKANLFISI